MDYIFKIEIELDDEKIIRENKYEVAEIYGTIRRWFAEDGIPEIKTGEHMLTFASNREEDFGSMGFIEVSLIESEWFKPYVTKMLWYENEDGDITVEDIIEAEDEYIKKYGTKK